MLAWTRHTKEEIGEDIEGLRKQNRSPLLTTDDMAFVIQEIMDAHSSAFDDGDMFEPEDDNSGAVYIVQDDLNLIEFLSRNWQIFDVNMVTHSQNI